VKAAKPVWVATIFIRAATPILPPSPPFSGPVREHVGEIFLPFFKNRRRKSGDVAI
jgi:hypothetical protein